MNEREKSIITPYFWPEQLDGLVPFTEVGNPERGPSLGIGDLKSLIWDILGVRFLLLS